MHTLRGRLLLSHILPILIVVPLVGLGIIYLLESQVLLDDLSDDLDERAALLAAVVEDQADIWQDPALAQEVANSARLIIHGQVLFLEPDGDLLATSDPELAGQIGQRPDLEGLSSALAGRPVVLVQYNVIQTEGQALVPVLNLDNELLGIVAVTESIAGLASDFGRLRSLVMLILLIEIVLAVILALVLSRRLVRPITQVTVAVGDIADGQRTEPIEEVGPLEVRQLATSVNCLARRLREVEDTRRRLLANLVHEIGRPLGAIRSAIHVLRSGAVEDPTVRDELMAGIEDEVERMQPLLDDLAQLHGQVLGIRDLNRVPLALSDWLPSVLLPWRAAAVDKGLTWTAEIPPNLPTVALDPDRMSQVIGNLLSNAIKYTPAGGEVAVSGEASQGLCNISVADSGPGIIAQEQEQVFEAFFRSRQQRRFPQGLGLGLTIARDIVEAHGGTLELDSGYEGGSRFVVHLRLAEPEGLADPG
jgi:signal transduction histidine kinase